MQKLEKAGLLRGNLEVQLEAGFEDFKFCNSRKRAELVKGSQALRRDM